MGIDWQSVFSLVSDNVAYFLATSFLVKAVKVFLFVYVVVLFLDIIMLLVTKGIATDLKKTFYGTKRPLMSKSKAVVRFEKIIARLKDDNPSQYKVAVLEADAYAEEILASIGHGGETMRDKLEAVHEGQIEAKDLLVEAHQVRNRIIHEADYALSREEAQKCLDAYQAFFHELELF
jgi:hypothetical protein